MRFTELKNIITKINNIYNQKRTEAQIDYIARTWDEHIPKHISTDIIKQVVDNWINTHNKSPHISDLINEMKKINDKSKVNDYIFISIYMPCNFDLKRCNATNCNCKTQKRLFSDYVFRKINYDRTRLNYINNERRKLGIHELEPTPEEEFATNKINFDEFMNKLYNNFRLEFSEDNDETF